MNTVPKKNIVFISYYFPPMGGGGVQRIVKFLKYWDYSKFSVNVITVKSSFFYAEDKDLENEIPSQVDCYYTSSLDPFRLIFPLKRFFSFYLKKRNHESSESGSIVRRITAFFFIPDSRVFWFPFVINQIRKLNKQQKIDFLIGTLPPFTSGLISFLSFYFFNIPYLVDFRDAWTNNPYLLRISKFHDYIQNKLEYFVLKKSAALVFVNPNLKKYYLNKYPFISNKPTKVIRNGFDPEDFPKVKSNKNNPTKRRLKIGILGSIYSQGNSPEPLFKAISNLIAKNASIKKELQLIFIGKWAPDFINVVKKYPITQIVHWIDYMSHRKLLNFSNQLDVLALAIDENLPGSENVTPGRIYEYLFFKKPIIAICPIHSDLANLVRENEAGEVVSYTNILKLQQIISEWITNPSQLNTYYKTHQLENFNRKNLTVEFLKFVDDIIS